MGNKIKLSDMQVLLICHTSAFLLIALYGLFANDLAEAFPSFISRMLMPANLSIWEQTKILVVPLSIIFPIEYFIIGKKYVNFIPAHLIIAFSVPMLMLGVYHLHNTFFGTMSMEGPQMVLSLTLLIAAFLASILFVTSETDMRKYALVFMILYFSLNVAYIIMLFSPPRLETFYDPIHRVFGPAY